MEAHQMTLPVLDCKGCNMKRAMVATKVPKFSGIVRFIGYVIVTPSIIMCIVATILFFSSMSTSAEMIAEATSDAERAGVVAGSAVGYGLSIIMAIGSLVGGLIGWLLIMKKKVFRCRNCGYILDRA
ncbi:MAG: hypothetical protein ACOWWM_20915 [Desulfobacterales bacterium]